MTRSLTAEVRRRMRNLNWSRGDCDACERTGVSVTPYGRDEDGQPIGYLCFIHAKRDIRLAILDRYEVGG
jgi:hypothetical protein